MLEQNSSVFVRELGPDRPLTKELTLCCDVHAAPADVKNNHAVSLDRKESPVHPASFAVEVLANVLLYWVILGGLGAASGIAAKVSRSASLR